MTSATDDRSRAAELRRVLLGRRAQWVPERALRYLPVVQLLRERDVRGRLLEVGVGDGGIGPYWRQPFVGLDLQVAARDDLLTPVEGSVLQLPFSDQAFPAVVCTDVLEHVAPPDRGTAVAELLRVTGRHLVLGVPTGSGAEEQDRQLDALHRRTHGWRHPFLVEHVEHGLPTPAELAELVRAAAGPGWRVQLHPNAPLRLRAVLMHLWIKGGPARRALEAGLLPLAAPLSQMPGRDHYRTLVTADRVGASP